MRASLVALGLAGLLAAGCVTPPPAPQPPRAPTFTPAGLAPSLRSGQVLASSGALSAPPTPTVWDAWATVVAGLPTPPPPLEAAPIATFPPVTVEAPTAIPDASQALPPRRLDPELDGLGVTIQPAEALPGEPYWRVVEIDYHTPAESGGRHHVYITVLDETGEPLAGVPVIFKWATGESSGPSPVNFPMFAAGHSYDVWVAGLHPSERVHGLGLGTPTSRFFNDHVEYVLTFQLAR